MEDNTEYDKNAPKSRQHIEVPQEAIAPFRGVSALQAGLSRGALFGLGGYALGSWIGDVGSKLKDAEGYSTLGRHTVAGMLGATGFILGAYIAMRQAQDAAKQHHAMRKAMAEMAEALGASPQAQVAQAAPEGRMTEPKKEILT